MTELVDILVNAWFYVRSSFTLQLFFVSAILLIVGLTLKTWVRALKLDFIENISLRSLEARDVHVPSTHTIFSIVLCNILLAVVGLDLLYSMDFFDLPFTFLYIVALFLLVASAGILFELHAHKRRQYDGAFLIGTTLAFIVLVSLYMDTQAIWTQIGLRLVFLLAAIWIAFKTLPSKRSTTFVIGTLVVFGIWTIAILLMQPA